MAVKCNHKECDKWRRDSSDFHVNNHCKTNQDVTDCAKYANYKNKESERANLPCINTKCNKNRLSESDGGNCKQYDAQGGSITECVNYKSAKGVLPMLNKAKEIATSARTTIKPYEKYIGLVCLAVVIDHFFLDSRFADRFNKLAVAIVDKITGTLDRVINKLTDGVIEDVDQAEDK